MELNKKIKEDSMRDKKSIREILLPKALYIGGLILNVGVIESKLGLPLLGLRDPIGNYLRKSMS